MEVQVRDEAADEGMWRSTRGCARCKRRKRAPAAPPPHPPPLTGAASSRRGGGGGGHGVRASHRLARSVRGGRAPDERPAQEARGGGDRRGEAAAAREQLEGFERRRSVPAEASGGAAGNGTRATMATAQPSCSQPSRRRERVLALEESVVDTGGSGWALDARAAAAARRRVDPTLDAVPARLRRLLVPAGTARLRRSTRRRRAATCCAATLALEVATAVAEGRYAQHLLLQGEAARRALLRCLVRLRHGAGADGGEARSREALRDGGGAAECRGDGGGGAVAAARSARVRGGALQRGAARRAHALPPAQRQRIEVVSEVKDEKLQIFDGEVMVAASTTARRRAPRRAGAMALERGNAWRRDVHPHDVLVQVLPGCATAWKSSGLKLSTTIDQAARGHGWRAQGAMLRAMPDGARWRGTADARPA